jgi:peptidoglycan/LPS O-acetylase OafA/YrhL
MSGFQSTSHYQPDIQGLRAVAVLMVLVYHSGLPSLPGGYVGVDVFFVISGYLITGLLLREVERSGTISLTQFYARRVRRLLPAATVVLCATVAIAWYTYSPLALKQFSASVFATAVYLSNVWFAHLATDYLAEDTNANPLLHTWSLGVEEQFYLAWPFLFLLALKWGGREALNRGLVYVFLGVLLFSFGAAYWLTGYNQPWAFFGSPTRAWEFAAGGLVAFWFSKGRLLHERIALLSGWAGLGLILLSAVLYTRRTPFPATAALAPVLGASLLIAAAHADKLRGANALLAVPPMQFIGGISYSLYLWHWPLFVFLERASPAVSSQEKIVGIGLVFALASATTFWVENPLRFNRRWSSHVFRPLILGGGLTLVSVATALGVRQDAVMSLEDPVQKTFLKARSDIPRIYNDNCHLDFLAADWGDCAYGDQTSDVVVVLFGDSHAAQWFPALERLALANNWRLISLTKSACASAKVEIFNQQLGRAYAECSEARENALDKIAQLNTHLTIITNSTHHKSDVEKASVWRAGMESLLTDLAPISDYVVIMRDTPRLTVDAPDCLSRAMWQGKDPATHCRAFIIDQKQDQMFRAERMAAEGYENVFAIDMTDSICVTADCPAYRNGSVKYRDKHHLTRRFVSSLWSSLGEELRSFAQGQRSMRRSVRTRPIEYRGFEASLHNP